MRGVGTSCSVEAWLARQEQRRRAELTTFTVRAIKNTEAGVETRWEEKQYSSRRMSGRVTAAGLVCFWWVFLFLFPISRFLVVFVVCVLSGSPGTLVKNRLRACGGAVSCSASPPTADEVMLKPPV